MKTLANAVVVAVVGSEHLQSVPHMVQELVHVCVRERHKLQNKKFRNQVSGFEIKYQVSKVGRQRGRQGVKSYLIDTRHHFPQADGTKEMRFKEMRFVETRTLSN